VTVDPGSSPDHEILGGRFSRVDRLLGYGEYPQDVHLATCSLVPNRQEGEEVYDGQKRNCSNGKGGEREAS
jgi:hypothetical protein